MNISVIVAHHLLSYCTGRSQQKQFKFN